MSIGKADIKFLGSDKFGLQAVESILTEANTTVINPGEMIKVGSAQKYAVVIADADGVIGTDDLIGIAFNTSTQTASADGTVRYQKFYPGTIYYAAAKSAAAVATQALYDALLGKRVLMDVTAGVQTVDTAAADSANNAIYIVPIDIEAYPGMVAFEVRTSGTSVN